MIDGADQILVLLYDGTEAAATVVGKDPETDLAVLKIAADNLQPISIGQPTQAKIGDVVLAIGNPYGVGQTVTQGIISAKGAMAWGSTPLKTLSRPMRISIRAIPVVHWWIATATCWALIRQSSTSPAPLASSFAIPANTAAKVLQDIISYGYVVRGWVGMEAFPLTPQIAKRLNLTISNGLLVRAIYNSSPAHLAGIQPGDIVIAINGEPVTDRQTSVNQIADVAPGTPIDLEIWRQGEKFNVTAVAGIRPTNSGN